MIPLFDDGRYVVTPATLATPTRIYPLAHATVRLRRDPLWLALGLSAFSVAALAVYADLLRAEEILAMMALPCCVGLVAINMGILAVDSPGHPRAILVTTAGRAKKIFRALRQAKLAEISGSSGRGQTFIDLTQ